MERAYSELTTNIERAQQAIARERIARARGDSEDDEQKVLVRHRWLFDRTPLDILGELRDRRFLDPVSVSAVGYHLRTIRRERVLADARAKLRRLPNAPIVVDENGTPLAVAIAEIAAGARPERVRGLELGIDALAARVAKSLTERVGEAHDAARELDVFVGLGGSTDVDRPLAKVDERARAFLDATDALADEMLDFLRGRHGGEIRTATTLFAALRRAELDDAVKPAGRARRSTELLRSASFASRIERHAAVEPPPPELSLGVSLVIPKSNEVRLLPGRQAQGILAELAFVEATGRALAILESHPGLPTYLARPRRGRLGRVVGSLFARMAFDVRRLRSTDAPDVARERTRRVAATATLMRARLLATQVLGRTSVDDLERATRVGFTPGIAATMAIPTDAEVRFEALTSGLAWAHALRELYDEDFLRHPSTREWLGTVFARAAVEPPEKFEAEVGARESAAMELRAFFDGRV